MHTGAMSGDRDAAPTLVSPCLRGVTPLRKAEWSGGTGYQGVFVHTGGLLFVRIAGKIPAGAETNRVTQFLSSAIAEEKGRVVVFFDLESFSHYDSEVRTRYTDAILAHTANVDHIWVYADSKMVRMGATVAGLVLPQLRLVARKVFDAELERAVAR